MQAVSQVSASALTFSGLTDVFKHAQTELWLSWSRKAVQDPKEDVAGVRVFEHASMLVLDSRNTSSDYFGQPPHCGRKVMSRPRKSLASEVTEQGVAQVPLGTYSQFLCNPKQPPNQLCMAVVL